MIDRGEGLRVRRMLWAVMYAVAVVGGVDATIITARYLDDGSGPAGLTHNGVSLVVGLVVATFLAIVPTRVYQRAMRAAARRRAEASPPGTGPAAAHPRVMGAEPAPAAAVPAASARPRPAGPPGPPPRIRALVAGEHYQIPEPPRAPQPREADVMADADRQVNEAEHAFGPDHRDTLAARSRRAAALWGVGHLTQAIESYREIVADAERALGDDDPLTLACRSDLAAAYEMDGQLPDAISLYQRVLSARERLLGPEHPDTVMSRQELAVARSVRANLSRGRGHPA